MAVAEQVVESCYAGHEFKGLFGQMDIGSMLGDAGQKMGDRRPRGPGYGRAKDPASALTVVVDVDYREEGWHFLLQSGAVQRILMNITGNALKYTPSGWVRVHLSTSEKDGETTVHINVSDSGKGISAEFLKTRLFSPFSQEDTLQAGTGLGMSIVKQVVERLGGQINVTSQVSRGTQVHVSLPVGRCERPQAMDSFSRVKSLTKDMKVFLAGFDNAVPASRLLYESIAHYLTNWYNMTLVDNVYSSDLIISDECPELLDYFQQQSPSERSAFAMSPTANSPLQFTPESSVSQSVYRAWQPLIVLCSNALRYELFGQQAETGKIIDFSSKPCGPYKLARSLLFCLEQAETRRQSMEGMMDQLTVSSPRRLPSRTISSVSTNTDDSTTSETNLGAGRRGSFGRGVVRFSPAVRRGSSDLAASMYVPGRGFVPTSTSSIVEPPRFVGMRRKSTAPPSQTPNLEIDRMNMDDDNWSPEKEQIMFKMPTFNRSVSSDARLPSHETPGSPPQRPPLPYNRRNPPRSIPVITPIQPRREVQVQREPSPCRPPHVLIVEDNSVNSLILATFLKKRGYPYGQAENGLLAVQAVQARPEGFDVILMDIQSTSHCWE
jgi:CheY-like chemotaxis protein